MHLVLKAVFLTTQGTQLRIERDAFRVERPSEPLVRIPVRQVDTVVAHGHITITTEALHRAAAEGISVVLLSRAGRFLARMEGPTSGNVLLRTEQFRRTQQPAWVLECAQTIVAAKLLNSRVLVLDAAKDREGDAATRLRDCAEGLAELAKRTREAPDLDHLRGIEGNGARSYFHAIGPLPTDGRLRFDGRSRRPPRNPANALLSYMYTLLRIRCAGALESVGLDPQCGYLHSLRPGRPSLALDLMEEFRAPFVDRFVLTVFNRRQLSFTDFVERPGGSWELTDGGRRTVLAAWDGFLDGEVTHRVLGTQQPRRHVPHLQALLLARHLRGDLDHYLPFRTLAR